MTGAFYEYGKYGVDASLFHHLQENLEQEDAGDKEDLKVNIADIVANLKDYGIDINSLGIAGLTNETTTEEINNLTD
jgi:hypothetical protein